MSVSRRVLNFVLLACVMNVISFKAAYSLYPRATFEDRCTLVCTSDIKRKNIVFTKYGTRGWTICTRAMECSRWEKSSQSAFSRRIRRVADRFTWKLPLDMTGVDVPPPRFGALEAPDQVVGECWSLIPELPLVRYMGPSRPRFRAPHAPRAGAPHYPKRFVYGARTLPRVAAPRAIPSPEPPARSLRASAPAFQPRGIKALETTTDVQAALRKYVELRPQVSEGPKSRARTQKCVTLSMLAEPVTDSTSGASRIIRLGRELDSLLAISFPSSIR